MTFTETLGRLQGLLWLLPALLVGCVPATSRTSADRAFVSEAATATIAVVDLDEGTVRRRIEVGLLPHNLVLSPDGRTLYTALAGSQAVAVVDTQSETLRTTWLTAPVPERRDDGSALPAHAERDAASHTTCYACHHDGGAKPRYVGARPVALRLSADGARLYVANLNSGELAVLDTITGERLGATTLTPSGSVREPAAVDLLGGELYVTLRAVQPSRVPGLVRRLDAQSLAPLGELPSGVNPVEVRSASSLGVALVTHFDSDQLSVLRDGREAARLTVASGPLGVLPLPGSRALVLGYYSNSLSLVDLAGNTTETWAPTRDGKPLANPTHAAMGTEPGVAWVVQSGGDSHLVAVDLASREVLKSLPINGLSYDVAIVRGDQP